MSGAVTWVGTLKKKGSYKTVKQVAKIHGLQKSFPKPARTKRHARKKNAAENLRDYFTNAGQLYFTSWPFLACGPFLGR